MGPGSIVLEDRQPAAGRRASSDQAPLAARLLGDSSSRPALQESDARTGEYSRQPSSASRRRSRGRSRPPIGPTSARRRRPQPSAEAALAVASGGEPGDTDTSRGRARTIRWVARRPGFRLGRPSHVSLGIAAWRWRSCRRGRMRPIRYRREPEPGLTAASRSSRRRQRRPPAALRPIFPHRGARA